MHRRHLEAVAIFIKPCHLPIGRQQIAEGEVGQGQQIAERVFIFAPRHPPHPRASLPGHVGSIG